MIDVNSAQSKLAPQLVVYGNSADLFAVIRLRRLAGESMDMPALTKASARIFYVM